MDPKSWRYALAYVLFCALPAQASAPDYHLVGWLNTAVPGAGQALLGNYDLAGAQATIEVTTFGWGYSMSPHHPLTLDGAPEELPAPDYYVHDITRQLYATDLQEFGIKFHMVNVYNAYREAAAREGVTEGIDSTSTGDLFLAPFKTEVLGDPWVWIPLSVSAAAITANYFITIHNSTTRIAKLSDGSNTLYAINYGLIIPTGSGAPEEIFYRGFVQNEFAMGTGSPYAAVTLSTLLYTFTHRPEERPVASVTGLYLGMLAYLNEGQLSKGIAYHFWADVMAGVSAYFILQKSQVETGPGGVPLLAMELEF